MDPRQQILAYAQAYGIDPSYALAVAERESSFDPNAGGYGSIRGAYQMSGSVRKQYGVPEGADLDTQTKGFAAYSKDLKNQMATMMGRQPTNAELYLGHHFGPYRAAKLATGRIAPDTPVSDIFTQRELATNPHIVRAGTAGALTQSITGDMDRRFAKHGGAAAAPRPPADVPDHVDFSQYGPTDFSSYAAPAVSTPGGDTPSTEKTPPLVSPEPVPPAKPEPAPQWAAPATDKQVLDTSWTTPLNVPRPPPPGAINGINPNIFGGAY